MATYIWPPVSVTTLPPMGGATSANQLLEIAELQDINAQTMSIDLKTPALVGGKVPVVTTAQTQTATFAEDLTVSTTPETFTAPAGAFAALIETDDQNATNIRVVMGGVASPTSGIQFQAGRSEIYKGGSNVSYCTESGTGKISIQWFIRT